MTLDFNEWVKMNGWDENDLQTAYKKVKRRRNIYGILSFTGLGILFVPFWARAAYLTKAIEYKDLDINVNAFIAFILGIHFICVTPLILFLIIKRTNWGMGINNI